jgi:hypothetical protein
MTNLEPGQDDPRLNRRRKSETSYSQKNKACNRRWRRKLALPIPNHLANGNLGNVSRRRKQRRAITSAQPGWVNIHSSCKNTPSLENFWGSGHQNEICTNGSNIGGTPKATMMSSLAPKGFFTIILYNLEDKDRIFENGPYFFNSAGLFLRYWTERFSPDKEDFTMAPVWIRLYSLPQEFWLEEILMGIGNTIGQYVKASEATKQRKYTSYARICVYMNIAKALPGTVILEYQDEDWAQTLDYEHIPFRCRKCHEHGHLFRDCPLNQPAAKPTPNLQKDGFTVIQAKKKNPLENR